MGHRLHRVENFYLKKKIKFKKQDGNGYPKDIHESYIMWLNHHSDYWDAPGQINMEMRKFGHELIRYFVFDM